MKKTYRAFSGGELSEDMYGRYDVDKYGTGCRRILNWILMAQGGAFFRPGTMFSAEAGDSSKKVRLIKFEFSTEQAYALELGHQYMRVYRNGGLVLEAAKNVVDVTEGSNTTIEVTSHGFSNGQEVYLTGLGGITQLNQRNFLVSDVTTDTFKLKDKQGNYIDSSAWPVWTAGGTVSRVYQIVTPWGQDELFDLYFAQTADVMTFVHPSYAPRELTRTGHTAWTLTTPTFAPTIAAPTGQSASWTGGAATVTRNYVITAIKDESFEESLPSAVASVSTQQDSAWADDGSEYVDITWSSVAGAVKYNIYKEKAGTYGFIGSAESTSFRDDRIAANVSNTPPRARNPFSGANKYPSVVTFQQQRQVFASTNEKPDTIFMSKAGVYKNMSVSIPNKDDDAITFAIASGQVNKIRHLIPFKNMLAMTTGAEWRIAGEYTPTGIEATPETEYGSSKVRPLMIGNTALFVGKYSRSVRDYNFAFESDGYDGNDLSILSKHLIANRMIVDWAYAAEPDKLVWAAMSDGKMCSLTYMKEHKVWGWARQELAPDSTGDAVVESVCVVPDEINRRDSVYFLVKRTVNGNTVRYIETLQDYVDDPVVNAYFFDCGLSRTGSATDTISGLWHLEGETVGILADGNVLPDATVEDGTITLPGEYSTVSVGLRYEGDLWPLPAESDNGEDGATKGDPKRIKTVIAELVRTRGIKAGQGPDDEVFGEQYPEFEGFDLSEAINTKTGMVELTVQSQWTQDGVSPFIKQTYPLPAKITSLTPVFDG